MEPLVDASVVPEPVVLESFVVELDSAAVAVSGMVVTVALVAFADVVIVTLELFPVEESPPEVDASDPSAPVRSVSQAESKPMLAESPSHSFQRVIAGYVRRRARMIQPVPGQGPVFDSAGPPDPEADSRRPGDRRIGAVVVEPGMRTLRGPVFAGLCITAMASACDAKHPAADFKLDTNQLPKGAEILLDGEVLATHERSFVELSMPEGKSLAAGKRTVRITMPCETVELSFELWESMRTEPMSVEDESSARAKSAEKKKPVEARLDVELGTLPRTQSVWVDAADGVVRVGDQVLKRGANKLYPQGCEGAQRTVTIAGKDVGALPAFDLTKHHPDLVIVEDASACYEWQPVVYSVGGWGANYHETKDLRGKHIHEVQFIHFFLEPPDPTVLGTTDRHETRYRFNAVDCDAPKAAVPADR